MCDPGEKISQTLKREFMEEATDSLGANKSNLKEIDNHLSSFFEKGVEVITFLLDKYLSLFIYDFLCRFIEGTLTILEILVIVIYLNTY